MHMHNTLTDRCLLLLGRLQLPRGRENSRRRVQCRLTGVRGIATAAASDSADGTADSTKACGTTRRPFGTTAWLGLCLRRMRVEWERLKWRGNGKQIIADEINGVHIKINILLLWNATTCGLIP